MANPGDTAKLSNLNRDELNIIAKKLKIKGYRRGTKQQLINSIVSHCTTEQINRVLQISFWDRYHNHIYGIATLIALVLSVIFYYYPRPPSSDITKASVQPSNTDSTAKDHEQKRVAVLDFVSTATKDDKAWLGLVLSSGITDKLRHFPEVQVYAPESLGNSLSDILYKKPNVKILTGQYVFEDKYVNISVRLINGATGEDVKASNFRIEVERLQELRDRLSDLILASLSIRSNLLGEVTEKSLSASELLLLEYVGRYKLALKQKKLEKAQLYLRAATQYGLDPASTDYHQAVLLQAQGRIDMAIDKLSQLLQSTADVSPIKWQQSTKSIAEIGAYKGLLFILSEGKLTHSRKTGPEKC